MNNLSDKTVLIVNDSPDQREMMHIIFEQAGYRASIASDGREGFQIAKNAQFDLIISDVIMPDGDGIELCLWIRSDEKLRSLPILLVSGLRKDVSDVIEGLEGGADDYIELPVDPLHLIARAERLIERKRMEDVLRESESHFRSLIENVSDIISIILPDGTILYQSPSLEQVLRYKPEQVIGENIFNLVHKDDKAQVIAFFNKNLQILTTTAPIEYRFRDSRGAWLILESVGKYINDPSKGLVAIITSRDVTERRQAEKALHESETHLRAIVSAEPECVKLLGLNGELLEMNPAGLAMIEADSLEQVLGRNIITLIASDYQDAFSALTEKVLKGESGILEFELIGLKGARRWLETHAVPLRNQSGEIISLLAVTRNMTARKETEKALAEANERAICEYEGLLDRVAQLAESLGSARDLQTIYRALYSFAIISVPCTGFFVSLYDAERNLRLPAYARSDGEEVDISQLPPMEMSGSPNSRAISTGTIAIEDDFQAAMRGKPIVNIGIDKHPDVPQSCLVAPMSVMGRIVGAVEVQSNELAAYTKEHATAMRMAANLTANAIENVRLLKKEREREEQLRLSQKLESVGRLAGGIAHDFNNMLTAINGYSDLTLRRLVADDPLRRNVEEIKKAGERSAALTRQLLAFSRQQVLKPKVLDLNEIINDTIQMLNRLIGEDIHLNTVLNSQLGFVEADPGQLTQVIMNLVVNARDAMPKGGNLTITTSNVYLDEEFAARFVPTQSGSYVLLTVTDTGGGIESEQQEHIFEPFFTTKEVGKGTGLGLATVYGIVKQSGGYIWVDSEVGKGTTFRIYLPYIDSEVKSEEEADASESIPKGQETVLIVEDEDMVRTLTRQLLEECGYRAIEARSGIEALSIIEKRDCEIDLVMTDIVMPQMSGRELAAKLAEDCPQMRVLFTSGYTDDEIIRHDFIKEDTNFIQKPFTFDALAHKVRESLDNRN